MKNIGALDVVTRERDQLRAFKTWVHDYLDQRGIPTHPDGPHSREGCRIGDRLDLAFAAMRPQEPIPENEAIAAKLRAVVLSSDGKPDGTRESLARCATMLDTYGPYMFPANELGQVHFARAMMESVADEIRAFLAADGAK